MVDLYGRQKTLDLKIPKKVCIIGVGGIGSWVALNMGLIGVKDIYVIDDDRIEEHNLNRTLFRMSDIGELKISAIFGLILERRPTTNFRGFNRRAEELSIYEQEDLTDCLIIDCRDVFTELPDALKQNPLIKLGYDGLSVTVMVNPDYKNIWDLDPHGGYEVIPSFLAPCQFLASMVTTLITSPSFDVSDSKTITLNVDEHFLKLLGGE